MNENQILPRIDLGAEFIPDGSALGDQLRAQHFAFRIQQETLLMWHEQQSVSSWARQIDDLWTLAARFQVTRQVQQLLERFTPLGMERAS